MLETPAIGDIDIDLDVDSFYATEGPLADVLDGFRERPQQKSMARSVKDALENGTNLMVEAGTGTGKSLAYLAPLAEFSLATNRPVVVSTNTINLQEQLEGQDAPMIREVLGDDFTFSLVKGRSNYLCPRRLKKAYQRRHVLFSDNRQQQQLEKLVEWEQETDRGTISQIDWNLSMDVWSKVNAKKGICQCLSDDGGTDCYYAKSRQRMQNTNLIIANHHLFMQDLSLRMNTDFGLLPKYGAAVIDEAHNLEEVARSCLGLQVTYLQFRYLLRDLHDPDGDAGFLHLIDAEDVIEPVNQLDRQVETFFDKVRDWYQRRSDDQQPERVYEPGFVSNTLDAPLKETLDALRTTRQNVSLDEDDDREFSSLIERMSGLKAELEDFVQMTRPEDVYWIETDDYRNNVTLRSSRVDVAPVLEEHLFSTIHSATLTSATLATASSDPFDYLANRLGMTNERRERLGHPFDYREQVTIRITPNMPASNDGESEYIEGLTRWLSNYLPEKGGDAFVLFTSYRVLNEVADRLRPQLEDEDLRVLIQGRDLPRHKILELFNREQPAVLFGASSFWEGVDVPGDSLRHVIITKLPFPNPTDPLTEATAEHLEQQGKNPFIDFFLPEAVLRLKQGFGRLIRNRDDTGEVSILDSRIANKRYGKQFLNALPDCDIITDDFSMDGS